MSQPISEELRNLADNFTLRSAMAEETISVVDVFCRFALLASEMGLASRTPSPVEPDWERASRSFLSDDDFDAVQSLAIAFAEDQTAGIDTSFKSTPSVEPAEWQVWAQDALNQCRLAFSGMVSAQSAIDKLDSQPPRAASIPSQLKVQNARVALAEHLCDEHDVDFHPIPGAHWPEDENDDGKREDGYVKIQPKHVQQRALEQADRILACLSALQPASTNGEMIETRNDEAGFVEFLNYDAPTIVRDIPGPCAILHDLNTRQVVGYRVYDPAFINTEREVKPVGYVSQKGLDYLTSGQINGAASVEPVRTRTATIALYTSSTHGEIEQLQDKIEGLQSDLDNAIEVAVSRGAVEWARLNYPEHYALSLPLVTPVPDEVTGGEKSDT